MEIDQNLEAKRFSRALGITIVAFRLTTIILMAMSLTLLVTNVLRVPDEENKSITIHFYDDSGFKFMVYVIAILIGYSAMQIFFTILQTKDNRDPCFVCVYYGELFSLIFLLSIAIEGFITTRSYQNWLGDAASKYDGYLVKSYASAFMLLLALICSITSLIVFTCGHLKRTSLPMNRYMSSKVNVVVDN